MSGIAGIVRFQGLPADRQDILKLTERLRTQGPDGLQVWVNGSAALGCAALHTTPEASQDMQPLQSPDGACVIVFDGRLDNREELHRKLQLQQPLASLSDARLVLHAWQAWQVDCPREFLGDFAFAVWNCRTQTLFLARDHMGARPVYFARLINGWAFASQDEALLGLPGVRADLDENRIADYLAPGAEMDPRSTWFVTIKAVLPGESIQVTLSGEVTYRDYWEPVHAPELRLKSEGDYVEAFQDVFAQAVRARLRTATAPAAMVSGGLDSAAIVAMVRRHNAGEQARAFHTYSALSDSAETCIESRCILELTRHPGTEAHTVCVPSMTGMVGVDDVAKAAWTGCHVTVSSILLPAMMALAAQRNGHKVLLMGTSGDVTMDVPLRYPARYWRQGKPWQAWRESQAAARNNTYLKGGSALKLWLLCGVLAALPAGWRIAGRQLLDRVTGKPGWQEHMSSELATRVQWTRRRERYLQRLFRDGAGESPAVKADFVFRWPGVTYGLTGFDRVAARHGLQFWDPWADRRVVEFFLRLPLEWQVRDGWTKYLVRRSFGTELSSELLWRKDKTHLGWHFADAALRHAPQTWTEDRESLSPYLPSGSAQPPEDTCRENDNKLHAEDRFALQALSRHLARLKNLA